MASDEGPRFNITCPVCQAVNSPNAVLCKTCLGPLSSQASTDPFQSIAARGDAFTRASRQPTRLITVIGIWLIFGNIGFGCFFGGLFALYSLIFDRSAPFFPLLLAFLLMAALFLVSVKLIHRTTKNYYRYKKIEAEEEAAEDARRKTERRSPTFPVEPDDSAER